jgi:hypothetical protein
MSQIESNDSEVVPTCQWVDKSEPLRVVVGLVDEVEFIAA